MLWSLPALSSSLVPFSWESCFPMLLGYSLIFLGPDAQKSLHLVQAYRVSFKMQLGCWGAVVVTGPSIASLCIVLPGSVGPPGHFVFSLKIQGQSLWTVGPFLSRTPRFTSKWMLFAYTSGPSAWQHLPIQDATQLCQWLSAASFACCRNPDVRNWGDFPTSSLWAQDFYSDFR